MGDRRSALRTLQEKKQLSYARDRRNSFGENDKSSRKNIRRNKRYPNGAKRHHARQILDTAGGVPDYYAADVADGKAHVKRRKRWRKWPDVPLRLRVEATLEGRLRLEGAQAARIVTRLRRLRGRYANGVRQGKRGIHR